MLLLLLFFTSFYVDVVVDVVEATLDVVDVDVVSAILVVVVVVAVSS